MDRRAGAELYTLYVGGIGDDADAGTLVELFRGFEPASARVVRDRATARCRGFGYVTFASVGSAVDAQLALDGQRLGAERLRVALAL